MRWSASAPTAVVSCVPLMSASPSFASSTAGARPAARSASEAGRRLPVPVHLPFPDEREREVRERREISRGADRALLGNDGVNSLREAREEKLQRLPADAGKPFREAVRAQQHDRPNGGRGKRRARAGRVAPHEVELERSELLPRDDDVGELPEPRRDAVDDPVLGDRAVDDGARRVDARRGARREDARTLAAGHGREIFE